MTRMTNEEWKKLKADIDALDADNRVRPSVFNRMTKAVRRHAKRSLCLALIIMMMFPGFAVAQDADDTEPTPVVTTWRITTSRTIIWMGDTITAVVNGSANVTVSLQLRPWNTTSQMFGNVSWQDTARTDRNGSAIFIVNTDDVESWGNFTLVLMQNEIPLARKYITINYDPYRWLEILIDRNTEHDLEQDADIEAGEERDINILEKFEKYWYIVLSFLIAVLVYFALTIELYLNYIIWKRKKAGKRVGRISWFLTDDNSEFFHQGGIMWDKPPKLPKVVNGVDMEGSGHVGMNTREIIKDISGKLGKGVSVTIQKMAPATEKSRWRRKRERKEIVKAGEEPKPASYLDLYKGD